ncbi:hypothetical protein RCS94_01250 [Orbaceae bacterium ac157xtp]
MITKVQFQVDNNVLYLQGILDNHSLNSVWQQQDTKYFNIKHIDTSQLSRVDSSGLALLTYLCIKYQVKLVSVNQQLKTLIELYDLDNIVLN